MARCGKDDCEKTEGKRCKECGKDEKRHDSRFSFKKVLAHFNDFYSLSANKMAFLGATTPAPNLPDGYLSLYTLNYPCVKNEKVSYKAWCADVNNVIYNTNIANGSGVTTYKLVSLLADSAAEAYTTLTENCCNVVGDAGEDCYPYLTTNFRAVNYILNETNRYVATLNPLNSEIQVAIWNLFHNEDLSDLQTYLFPDADLAIVRMIVDTALAAQTKWQLCPKDKIIAENKVVGLLGFPDRTTDADGAEKCYQVVLLPIRLADFQHDFDKCSCL